MLPSVPVAIRSTIVALVLLCAACGGSAEASTQPIPGTALSGTTATVVKVVDGDTVELRFAGREPEMVRLLGIDTPETVHPDRPVECFGPEASARAAELLPAGSEVLVQRDAEARDRFGRLLAYIWTTDGIFVNADLVAGGYADTLAIAPNNTHRSHLSGLAAEARAADAGLWGACPAD